MDYDTQRRNRNGGGSGGYRRHSRSRTRSRSRERSRDNYRHRSRERSHRGGGVGGGGGGSGVGASGGVVAEKDLYRDIINDDYQEDNKNFNTRNHDNRNRNDDHNDERDRHWNDRGRDKGRDYDRDYDKPDRKDRYGSRQRYNSSDRDSDNSDETFQYQYYNKTPSNTIIVLRLKKHITEADIMSALIQQNTAPTIVRLIRKRETGASRGFAFVEFNTVDEAAHWMELNQGSLMLGDVRAELQYSYSREHPTDWYCLKCGVYNFRRRDKCFRCYASREESSQGAEGGDDEVSNILTKKIMLRNLDTLTNEEGVLTTIQQHVPDLVKKITKILISRDTLTQTSRGICYLNFETLVDSMNLHNALVGLEPPLKIDNREVRITYCVDHENRQIVPKKTTSNDTSGTSTSSTAMSDMSGGVGLQYTLADVPRLAEYSASLYATTPEEQAHYLQYYTDYYVSEINKGQYANLPTVTQMTEANSGAAVALSAIQRKQKKMNSIETTATQAAAAAAQAAANVKAALAVQIAQNVVTPKGNDGKIYPVPDVSLYQYDETSGYYYDPTTGLYYDAHSQYYYNNETGAYLYWDQRKSTYVLATPAAAAASVEDVVKQESTNDTNSTTSNAEGDDSKKEKKDGNKQDKVKVAKKIVKDMEKWAKQLNQKKDYTAVATPQPILGKSDALDAATSRGAFGGSYADIGFSILEKKERNKLSDYVAPAAGGNKLLAAYGGSDSDDEQAARVTAAAAAAAALAAANKTGSSTTTTAVAAIAAAAVGDVNVNERDYVDFQKLTCLLCKRAFQSLDILQKHLKMSNLHKENLQKYSLTRVNTDSLSDSASSSNALSYRDRAKERRLKYGECDPPPPNRTRERFENEIKSLTSRASAELPAMPIASNNVGSRLLQKMGWSEGQGLGRKNQGRTNIIEADTRNSTAGLGTKTGMGPNDDYKTYIKKMMKSRYESV